MAKEKGKEKKGAVIFMAWGMGRSHRRVSLVQ